MKEITKEQTSCILSIFHRFAKPKKFDGPFDYGEVDENYTVSTSW